MGVYEYDVSDEENPTAVFLGAPRVSYGATTEATGDRVVVARGYKSDIVTGSDQGKSLLTVQSNILVKQSECSNEDVNPEWNESDRDCGGDLCASCEDGRDCNFDADCESHNCDAGICTTPVIVNPCDAYCTGATPIALTRDFNYQSLDLGTGTTCREIKQYVDGLWCGQFTGSKDLLINGTPMHCGSGSSPRVPPAQNGGYCLQSTAGNFAWATYSLWDTTRGATPL